MKKSKWIGGIVILALLLMMLPCFGAEIHDNQVHVIVENTTFTPESEDWSDDFWYGILVDTWVDIDVDKETSNDTMMSCIVDALTEKGYEQDGAENNYIATINGLSEFDGGSMSGWMGTLNDWFTDEGFANFSVKNGKLEAGDEIRVMYTVKGYGEDLGSSWSNDDKSLKALTFSTGELSPAFDGDVHEYILTVSSNVKEVYVTPTASNKNFQVRTSVNGKEYKRRDAVPIKNGTVIVVKDGDKSWAPGGESEAQIYAITINVQQGLLMGDANNDGQISIDDVNSIQMQLANMAKLSETGKTQADVNGDSKVTIDDANRIQLYLAKIIHKF